MQLSLLPYVTLPLKEGQREDGPTQPSPVGRE